MKRWLKPVIAAVFTAVFLFTISTTSASDKGKTGKAKSEGAVTFNKDIAPIFYAKCADCHRPGEAGTFSVLSFKDARPWARSIKEKVVTREMPPWHADPHVGKWANDRRLTAEQVEKIAAWVDQGAVEGDPRDLPPAPKFA
jgi:mono/diheme cytochrome c family protein